MSGRPRSSRVSPWLPSSPWSASSSPPSCVRACSRPKPMARPGRSTLSIQRAVRSSASKPTGASSAHSGAHCRGMMRTPSAPTRRGIDQAVAAAAAEALTTRGERADDRWRPGGRRPDWPGRYPRWIHQDRGVGGGRGLGSRRRHREHGGHRRSPPRDRQPGRKRLSRDMAIERRLRHRCRCLGDDFGSAAGGIPVAGTPARTPPPVPGLTIFVCGYEGTIPGRKDLPGLVVGSRLDGSPRHRDWGRTRHAVRGVRCRGGTGGSR
jgi:hypothetical protein